jgi:hypothetical protein
MTKSVTPYTGGMPSGRTLVDVGAVRLLADLSALLLLTLNRSLWLSCGFLSSLCSRVGLSGCLRGGRGRSLASDGCGLEKMLVSIHVNC